MINSFIILLSILNILKEMKNMKYDSNEWKTLWFIVNISIVDSSGIVNIHCINYVVFKKNDH